MSNPKNNKPTIAISTDLIGSGYKLVNLLPNDNFYLNGILYSGNAYLKTNGQYVVRDPKIAGNDFINLAYKGEEKIVLKTKRFLSKTTKAKLQDSKINILNRKKEERLKNILRGTKLKRAQGRKIIGRSLGKKTRRK